MCQMLNQILFPQLKQKISGHLYIQAFKIPQQKLYSHYVKHAKWVLYKVCYFKHAVVEFCTWNVESNL